MPADLFVTGTDTNVGKTLLSALLVAALDAIYWKPIQTGASEGTDRKTVMQWADIAEDRTLPESYCFDPPVSPHLAAEAAGVQINLSDVRQSALRSQRALVVEGAGGILVPINDSELMIDLARRLALPVVVASRTALGTINHTLLTVRALRAGGLAVRGVVMIGPPNADNERSIERYGEIPVIGRIPWLAKIDRAALLHTFQTGFDRKYFEC
jgi:dethiobiotin synthase